MDGTSNRIGRLLGALAVLAGACSRPEEVEPRFEAAHQVASATARIASPAAASPAARAPEGGSASAIQPVRAGRCGECHAQIKDEWAGSPHARAAVGPVYTAMRQAAGSADCDRCHAPWPALRNEGVTCDVCHRAQAARPDRGGGHLVFAADERRRGPLCDAQSSYFHPSECSPLQEDSELCGACHLWTVPRAGGELPLVTEFDEWRRGPYPDIGVGCQGCHMPVQSGEAATGAGVRKEIHQHRMLGRLDDLRARALTVNAVAEPGGDTARITVELTNTGAGHAVPSGLAGRQVVLRVIASDRQGVERGRQERLFSRVLVDAAGLEVPFHLAERVAIDNRISPDETRRESFELPYLPGGRVAIAVLWRAMSPSVAAALGAPAPETMALHERTMVLK